MARVTRFRLDERGFQELLKSPALASVMQQEADAVASHIDVQAHDGPVEVLTGTYTTDRVNAAVTLAHPAGLAIEAAHGTLARALAAEGLPLHGGGA